MREFTINFAFFNNVNVKTFVLRLIIKFAGGKTI